MKLNNGKITDINIAYIGGGSREWAIKLMIDLALEEALSGTVKLYDIAVEYAQDNANIGNNISARDDVKGIWKYTVAENIEDALKNADFVIVSILPGTFNEMHSDVHAPEKYGIYQSVGDTVGPGGLIRALRIIPTYFEFALAIKKYCPEAWVINFSNPMTLCTRALYEAFHGIKAFGCCHEVFNVQILLASMVSDFYGISSVSKSDIKTNVLGINHFTWVDKASYKNIDLFPLFKKFSEKYKETGYNVPGEQTWEESVFKCACLVKFDLFNKYGLIGAACDRHLVEFLPLSWYLKDPETVKSWKFRLTKVEYRIDRYDKQNERRKKIISGHEKIELIHTKEESVDLIKAIVGIGDFISNINIPNIGQMKNVPYGAVIETNALFSRDSVRPVFAGKLPDNMHNLVIRHILNQETIIKAFINKDRDLLFTAFINDPLVTLGLKEAKQLFEEMIDNTKKYLPEWLYK
jgi:alpha-galactosidase/6-phospho-beta-glucosidase family protein